MSLTRLFTLITPLALVPAPGWAQSLQYSSDVGTILGGEVVQHGQVVMDPQTGTVAVSNPLALPAAVDLSGLELSGDGGRLFSVDRTVLLDGVLVTRSDVGRLSAGVYSLAFDGSAEGIPAGAGIDALTLDGDELLLSFDTTVDFQAFVAFDEDLVRFDGVDFTLELDLSAQGAPVNLDLEAAHRLDDGTYLLSLSTHGDAGGVSFADEDVLGLDPSDSSWSMVFDGATVHAGLGPVAIDALATAPEDIFKDGFEDLVMLFR